ncbi:hypothetical protein ACJ41O_001797 [Fusarium nematophilum]
MVQTAQVKILITGNIKSTSPKHQTMAHFINKLQNKRVLVLGGSTGIGFAVALASLEHGADVILSSSNQEKIDKAIHRLETHIQTAQLPQRKIFGNACDLSDPATLEENVKNLLEFATQAGKIDHVVFTAGNFIALPALDAVTTEHITQLNTVRITGCLILAKHLPGYINHTSESSLTVTASTTHWRPGNGWSVLNGAAGGVESMARGLAVDLKPLRVNCVTPGFVHTELFDGFPQEALEGMFAAMKRESLIEKVGTAEELAEAYVYLMKSTFATGSTVVVDGGRMVGDSKPSGIGF